MIVDQIAQWCRPWNELFGHSKLVAGSVTGAHIVSLMFGGGFAIASDRATLRANVGSAPERAAVLREVSAVHRPVLIALFVLFASGVLLALADVETFLPSAIFWTKLAFVALLVANGGLLTRTERRLRDGLARDDTTIDARLWRRMRRIAWSSAILWTLTAVVGIVLSNAA